MLERMYHKCIVRVIVCRTEHCMRRIGTCVRNFPWRKTMRVIEWSLSNTTESLLSMWKWIVVVGIHIWILLADILLQITQWHNVIGSLQHLTVPLHWTFDRGLQIPMYFIRKIREVTPSALEKSSLKIVHFSFSRKMHFNSNIFKRNLNFQFGPENLRNAKNDER